MFRPRGHVVHGIQVSLPLKIRSSARFDTQSTWRVKLESECATEINGLLLVSVPIGNQVPVRDYLHC